MRRVSSATRAATICSSSSSPSPGTSRNQRRRRVRDLQTAALIGADRVDLVVDVDDRHIGGADLFQHATDGGHVPLAVRARRVDDVQREIGFCHFFQRGAERRDQRMRQSIDESDRIGHEQLALIAAA